MHKAVYAPVYYVCIPSVGVVYVTVQNRNRKKLMYAKILLLIYFYARAFIFPVQFIMSALKHFLKLFFPCNLGMVSFLVFLLLSVHSWKNIMAFDF